MSTASEAAPAKAPRDPRLDVFRGLGMFIILVAHIPWNPWMNWIPARYGFSDAADMFVFCSGMASALAFARVFDRHGWWIGVLRIAHRIWQVYWAHIGSLFIVLALVIAADQWLGTQHYARQELAFGALLDDPAPRLLGIVTLTYVPSYFDILPMYMAVLAMVPVMMGVARWSPPAALALSVATWVAAQAGLVSFTADPWTGRPWFFNPFGWQLLFFTGFAFIRGWLPTPPKNPILIGFAIAIVVLAAPVSCQEGFPCYAGWGTVPLLGQIHDALLPAIGKIDYGPLRYLHFLATAYLAFLAAGPRGSRLTGPVAEVLRRVGQQTLAVFLTGLVMAQPLGVVLDLAGHGPWVTAAVNLFGFAMLIAAARFTSFFKAPPWSQGGRGPRPAPAPATPSPGTSGAPARAAEFSAGPL